MNRVTRHLFILITSGAIVSCGGAQKSPDPASFAKGWKKHEAVNFTIHVPPNSAKTRERLIAFGDACDINYDYATKRLQISTDEDIHLYLFNSTEDCEKATGRSADFVERLNIYTRIGAQTGGLIAEALCNTIDPAAPSFPLLRDGIRNLLDHRDLNIHQKAAEIRATSAWPSIEDLLDPTVRRDPNVYTYASASFVAFLIQRYGVDQFRFFWRSSLDIRASIQKIYGGTLPEMEEEWFRIQDRVAKRS